MSDQPEKPKGSLPKGYEPNAQGEPQDQDKKIWDKYYNGEIELPDVVKELKHIRSSKDTELETSDEDRDAVLKAWRRTQNIYGYTQQKAKSKQGMEKEREEYEKKYLARYKEPKVKPKKLTKLKSDIDLGKLNLRKHAVTKQKKYLAERKDYERKYLARYKQPKVKPKKLSNLKSDADTGILTLQQYINTKRKAKQNEIREYEKKFLSRYKQPKAKKKTSSSNSYKPEKPKPKRDMKKERMEYEKKYLARYKQPKVKPKKKK